MAEWLNAADCKSAPERVRRFESYSSHIFLTLLVYGPLAYLVERLVCTEEVRSSNLLGSIFMYDCPTVPIAQRIEQQPSKLEVDGSNPSGNKCPYRLAVQDATLSRWRSRVRIPLGIDLIYVLYFVYCCMSHSQSSHHSLG